jgi:hypothetical protein
MAKSKASSGKTLFSPEMTLLAPKRKWREPKNMDARQ